MLAEDAEGGCGAKKTSQTKLWQRNQSRSRCYRHGFTDRMDFNQRPGSGKHWIDSEGKDRGRCAAPFPGDPHVVLSKAGKSAKPKFSGGATAWEPTIGDMKWSAICQFAMRYRLRRSSRRILRSPARARIPRKAAKKNRRDVYLYSAPGRLCRRGEK